MKRWLDITLAIHPDMLNWPSNPRPEITLYKSLAAGERSNVSLFNICAHTGTHVDSPGHSLPNRGTVDELPLDKLIGPVRVFDLPGLPEIRKNSLIDLNWENVERVIFKTDNVKLLGGPVFNPNYVYLAEDAAQFLVNKNLKVVGIDYFSVEKYHDENKLTHKILLEAGIIAIEGLDLRGVTPGDYTLYCLPLKIKALDGAPARVILGTVPEA